MTIFRLFLCIILAGISIYTGITIGEYGTNLVPLFFGEMTTFSWQGQFNFDFMTFLLLSGLWTAWRNGFTVGAIGLGVFATVFGMMFLAAYLLYLSFQTDGDIRRMLLGVHAS
ncbi:MAG: hypothetical protein AAF197_03970 [Pseudomonadota bacterium]